MLIYKVNVKNLVRNQGFFKTIGVYRFSFLNKTILLIRPKFAE